MIHCSVRLRYLGAALCAAVLAGRGAGGSAVAAGGTDTSIDSLARDVERTEAIRAVKNLQYAYTQYAQFGLWAELGSLFSQNGETIWGNEIVKGSAAIVKYHMDTFGGGKEGLPPGVVNSLFVEVPLVNLSVDGNRANARWYGFSMLGGGADARWESGTFENEYVKDNGVWRVSRLHFVPQFAGRYESGWRNVTNPLPLVPYHFKTEDEAGTPIPAPVGAALKTTATLASLERRIDTLNAEDQARNLQNAYGYYIDRKMWNDVTDLFTSDGVLEIGGVGIYHGAASVRRARERDGPTGLEQGQLNDHPLFDTMIAIAPEGTEARVRGLDLGMLGDFASARAQWSVSVFDNRFVRQDGVWKIRELRVFPLFKSDSSEGWGKSRIVEAPPAKAFAPDQPVPVADSGNDPIPAFLPNPVTGREVTYPTGTRVVAKERLLPPLAARASAAPLRGPAARLTEAARRLSLSTAYDGAMNITAAYTHYIDDGQWTSIGAIFAEHGGKEVPFNGYYFGPERIAHRPGATPAINSTNPGRGGWHWLLQPVITVASDGRSAKMRTRLFHPATGFNAGGGIEGGMYPNNPAVLEKGVWKLWSVTIDEPYFSAQFPFGWSRTPPSRPAPAPRTTTTPAPPPGNIVYPPDIPLSKLGERMQGFVGGTGDPIRWPGILIMWFHYKNPVSGRVPEHYWPNCGTCEYAPDTSMEKHGYTLPPS
jgi:hypothetical protein